PVAELLNDILGRTGYARIDDTQLANEQELQRRSNVDELLSAARLYDEQSGGDSSLNGFLESASLAQDVDSLDTDLGAVTLMTLHAAKGLEFPCVYIIGVEQNLLPHERSLRSNDGRELEEERRLLFVGLTRAEQQLVLTQTYRREMHGRELSTIPSEFLSEMPLMPRDCTGDVFETEMAAYEPEVTVTKVPLGFHVGMAVRHPRYGLGTVVDISPGLSRRRTLTVEFQPDGRRESFIAGKCPLQPVGVQ
ncbi:MAG: ATP-dependent DNA helicase, partial [Planctomycetales bacterium 12-60-4]